MVIRRGETAEITMVTGRGDIAEVTMVTGRGAHLMLPWLLIKETQPR